MEWMHRYGIGWGSKPLKLYIPNSIYTNIKNIRLDAGQSVQRLQSIMQETFLLYWKPESHRQSDENSNFSRLFTPVTAIL